MRNKLSEHSDQARGGNPSIAASPLTSIERTLRALMTTAELAEDQAERRRDEAAAALESFHAWRDAVRRIHADAAAADADDRIWARPRSSRRAHRIRRDEADLLDTRGLANYGDFVDFAEATEATHLQSLATTTAALNTASTTRRHTAAACAAAWSLAARMIGTSLQANTELQANTALQADTGSASLVVDEPLDHIDPSIMAAALRPLTPLLARTRHTVVGSNPAFAQWQTAARFSPPPPQHRAAPTDPPRS